MPMCMLAGSLPHGRAASVPCPSARRCRRKSRRSPRRAACACSRCAWPSLRSAPISTMSPISSIEHVGRQAEGRDVRAHQAARHAQTARRSPLHSRAAAGRWQPSARPGRHRCRQRACRSFCAGGGRQVRRVIIGKVCCDALEAADRDRLSPRPGHAGRPARRDGHRRDRECRGIRSTPGSACRPRCTFPVRSGGCSRAHRCARACPLAVHDSVEVIGIFGIGRRHFAARGRRRCHVDFRMNWIDGCLRRQRSGPCPGQKEA
jgi:hypothetical protein